MNKKTFVVLSCLLVNMPIFAKGLFPESIIQSHRHSLVKNENNQIDFSGSWVGNCSLSEEPFKMSLNIVQTDKNITLNFDDEGRSLPQKTYKFPIAYVKVKSAGALNSSGHSMSSALWSYGDRLSLFMHRIGMEAFDGGGSSYAINTFALDLGLEKGKLFFYHAYGEEPFCSFDKQA